MIDELDFHKGALAMIKESPDECCGNCYSFKRRGEVYNTDHCKDALCPAADGIVKPDWWCPRYSRRNSTTTKGSST